LTGTIDTHAHLDEIEDLEPAIERAKESGLKAIIAMGSHAESNKRVIEICQKHNDFIYPAVGLHPWELGDLDSTHLNQLLQSIEEKAASVAAIGEIGLDYDKRVIKRASKDIQKEILKHLLGLAKKYNKPVAIHSRYAWKDCFDLVHGAGIRKAVFHWFTGFSSVLRDILDAGYFISCTPAAEYHEEHKRAIKETPLEQLLLETDCPVIYGREIKYRSQPVDIIRSLKAAAFLKETDEISIAQITTANARQLFNIETA
jgi:TatD DNase family protein